MGKELGVTEDPNMIKIIHALKSPKAPARIFKCKTQSARSRVSYLKHCFPTKH